MAIPVKPLRKDGPFLRACFRREVPYTPVWLMRQAGRYMAEYNAVRSKVSFLELCRTPELACQVTVEAVEKIKADAAIIFSDILLALEVFGLELQYDQGNGPVIRGLQPDLGAIEALQARDPEPFLGPVIQAVRLTRSALRPELPLIGFSGAPFTLAAYALEGGGSKDFSKTKAFFRSHPGAWHRLLGKIVRVLIPYLAAQAEAGADALQVFDSWAGILTREEYREFVLPHSRALLSALPAGIPAIHFGTGTAPFLDLVREAGGQVIGADHRIRLDEAWKKIGEDRAIQGNLDPAVLFQPLAEIRKEVKGILDQAASRPGHIFNLGHGIRPNTPVDHVIALVEMVHEMSRRA